MEIGLLKIDNGQNKKRLITNEYRDVSCDNWCYRNIIRNAFRLDIKQYFKKWQIENICFSVEK